MSFSLYEKEELEAIAKKEESNNRMEEFFNNKREIWTKDIQPILETSKLTYNSENAQKIVDLQVDALVHRERLQNEIAFYLQQLSKEKVKYKRQEQDKLVWYALGKSPLNIQGKVSNSQMSNIIDGHLVEAKRATEIIETHIEHLRSMVKMLTDVGYLVKNTIEIYNFLSKN
jgi:ATP-dependent Lon protease